MTQMHNVWVRMDSWQHWFLLALAVATAFQSLFVVTYVVRPWWRDRVGRAYMLKSGSLCLVLWISLVNVFFVYTGQEPISTFAMWAVTLAIVYQYIALLRTPRHVPGIDPEMKSEKVPS